MVDFYMILYLWELHLRTESQECLMFMYMVLFQAFVDSGAQSTIISKSCAERCGYVFFFFFFGVCARVCVRSDAFLKNPFFMQVTVVVKLMVCLLIS